MKNLKNTTALVFGGTFCLVLLINASPAQAHLLKTDGSIGAVLHIDPEDDPIAKQRAYFFFELKDKTNRFKPADCDCVFSISRSNKEIYSQPLFQNNPDPDLTNARASFVFPEKNIYEVKVTGKPVVDGAFQPFVLAYDVRVARETPPAAAINGPRAERDWFSGHGFHLAFSLTVIVILIIITLIKRPPEADNK